MANSKKSPAEEKRNLTTGSEILTHVNWKQHDEIYMKIFQFNQEQGLKHFDRWTYEKLAQAGAIQLGISYQDAWRMGVDKLIQLQKTPAPTPVQLHQILFDLGYSTSQQADMEYLQKIDIFLNNQKS